MYSASLKAAKAMKEKEEEEHSYLKREGHGHNRDFCNVCREGGELVCCEKCPASYHLQCHYPAMDPTDIFNGEWLCYACYVSKRQLLDCKINEKKKKSGLEILAFAASLINPREFELPEELQLPIMFPGSSKIDCMPDRTVEKSHCLNNSLMVPLPTRMCFQCGRSCRKAPLIACDYCPSYFHQDCLDPPLIAFPISKWMCPNHPNHFIEQNLLSSCRVTERMKLFDKYVNQPIDQHAIKLDFMRKTRTANSLFRTKIRLEGRPRIKVPDSIKFHYKSPLQLDLNDYQNNFMWHLKNIINKNGQYADFKKTDNNENICMKNIKIEGNETNKVNKERKECDKTSHEESDQQKESDMNEVGTSKTENETAMESFKAYNNLEFHARCCGYNIKEGIKLLERPVLEALAQQRLEEMLNPGESYKTIIHHKSTRAALISLNPKPNLPAFITRSSFVIGNAPDCDLILSDYGTCGFTSSKHAIIFFDEATKYYELLNYSEYGTVVDNVLYSYGYTSEQVKEEKTDKMIYITKEEETSEIIKTILHKEEAACFQEHASRNNTMLCKCNIECNIKVNKHLEEGWEGSAVIAHGSIITFGCLMFVFNTLSTYVNE